MTAILIADGNPRDYERYRSFLSDTDLEFVHCQDGSQAMTYLDRNDPELGVIALTWELRGPPTGPELLIDLRRRRSDVPVIAVFESLDVTHAAHAKALGAKVILQKPLDRDRVRAAVARARRGEPAWELLQKLRERIVGSSVSLLEALKELLPLIASGQEPVLLVGESGTGKELFARAIHDFGSPAKSPFLPVNVASLVPTLLEAELFGVERGAFTGANESRAGLFEQCEAGCLFLDEICELQLDLQTKLLRVIQERTFRRVGGKRDLPCDGRLLFATNRSVVQEVSAKRFRKDLYFRIARHTIEVPPLRDRADDRWELADYFLRNFAKGRELQLAAETRTLLTKYPFPGNVRELEGLILHAVANCREDEREILPTHLDLKRMSEWVASEQRPGGLDDRPWPETLFALPLKEAARQVAAAFDRAYLRRKYEEAGKVGLRAAELAEVDPKTFRARWKAAGLGPIDGEE